MRKNKSVESEPMIRFWISSFFDGLIRLLFSLHIFRGGDDIWKRIHGSNETLDEKMKIWYSSLSFFSIKLFFVVVFGRLAHSEWVRFFRFLSPISDEIYNLVFKTPCFFLILLLLLLLHGASERLSGCVFA